MQRTRRHKPDTSASDNAASRGRARSRGQQTTRHARHDIHDEMHLTSLGAFPLLSPQRYADVLVAAGGQRHTPRAMTH